MNSPSGPADAAGVRSGEDGLIQRWFAPIAGSAGLGLRDDAACLEPPPGCDLVLTADALVAGVHFFPDDPPDAIARKALRVNLSDLAAKAAEPLGFLLSIALPPGPQDMFLEGFSRGLGEDSRTYACPLVGGDTVSTPGPLMVSITALGAVERGRMVRRDGAAAGDAIFVTGTIGDAALGLAVRRGRPFAGRLAAPDRDHLVDRYLLPRPRNALTKALREHASAAMDISDGFAGDLAKLCAASGIGAAVDIDAVPFSPPARAAFAVDETLRQVALTGGDDYEIVGSCPPGAYTTLVGLAREAGIVVTRIAIATNRRDLIVFRKGDGSMVDLPLIGYSHPGSDP